MRRSQARGCALHHLSLRFVFAAVAVFGVMASSEGRAAATQKEWILALQPGFAFVKVDTRMAFGGGGGLDLSYGVTDALAVRITGSASEHWLDPVVDPMTKKQTAAGGPLSTWHAGAGVTYSVDIIRLVPYFDLAIGLLGAQQPVLDMKGNVATKTTNEFGVEVGLGVDYLLTKRIAIGVVVRYHAYLTALQDIPVYVYAGPRLAIHFGG